MAPLRLSRVLKSKFSLSKQSQKQNYHSGSHRPHLRPQIQILIHLGAKAQPTSGEITSRCASRRRSETHCSRQWRRRNDEGIDKNRRTDEDEEENRVTCEDCCDKFAKNKIGERGSDDVLLCVKWKRRGSSSTALEKVDGTGKKG